jgi:hypothetical protein
MARWRRRPVPVPPEIFDPGFPLVQWLDEAYGNDPARWLEVYGAVMRTPVREAAGDDDG